jgi:hypothetical protein
MGQQPNYISVEGFDETITRVAGIDAVKVSRNGITGLNGLGGIGVADERQTLSARLMHTGATKASASTDGTNLDIVTTETYVAELFVPANATLTGIAIFNGSAVAGNVQVFLADSTGAVVASSASTAQSGTDAYQRVPFIAPYAVKGPGTYYVAVQGNNAGGDINTHIFGNFGAGKLTSTVFGTLVSFTPPTTFTTGLGPICSLY